MRQIPIFFTVHNNYAPYLAVTLLSLKSSKKQNSIYNIKILYSEMTERNITYLQSMEAEGFLIECVDVEEHTQNIESKSEYFPREVLYRILISDLYPEYKKVLYLDCDLIIREDVTELYEIDLEDCVFGASQHVMGETTMRYVEETLSIPYKSYHAAGVLVINAEKYREEQIAKKCLDMYAQNGSKYLLIDQDILNIVCYGKIKDFPMKWNVNWHYIGENILNEYEERFKEAVNEPAIIHYSSSEKPWKGFTRPLAEYFWQFARQSIYYEEILYNNLREKLDREWKELEERCKRYLFPYEDIPYNSRIVLYAAGKVGKAFCQQIQMTHYCKIVAWVDKQCDKLQRQGFDVDDLDILKRVEFDYVVIAVENRKVVNEIEIELTNLGIHSSKLIWRYPRI